MASPASASTNPATRIAPVTTASAPAVSPPAAALMANTPPTKDALVPR